MSEEVRTQKLVIESQDSIYTKGNGATLYEVTARDEKGELVPDLRTFGELPKGELQEFEMKRYYHPERGVTWTIKAPSGGLGKKVGELEARLADAIARIEALESRLGEPEHEDVHPRQTRPEDGPVKGPDFF